MILNLFSYCLHCLVTSKSFFVVCQSRILVWFLFIVVLVNVNSIQLEKRLSNSSIYDCCKSDQLLEWIFLFITFTRDIYIYSKLAMSHNSLLACNHFDSIHDSIGVRKKEENSVFLSSLRTFHVASFFPFCTWMKDEVSIANTSMHLRTLICLRRHINKGNNRAIVLCFGHFVDFSLLISKNICHSLFHQR